MSVVERLRRLQEHAEMCAYDTVAEAHRDAADRIEALEAALRFYADPEIYKPHPHGPAFDDRDVSYVARAALKVEQ